MGTCAGPMSLLIQTCHRRLQQCIRSGVLKGVLEALALDLKARDAMDVREAFIDGRFAAAKKGRQNWKSKHGKGTKIMAIRDREGLPVAVHVESATPHEVKLVVPTLVEMLISEAPQNLVGDNAYDSGNYTQNSATMAYD